MGMGGTVGGGPVGGIVGGGRMTGIGTQGGDGAHRGHRSGQEHPGPRRS
jgi:hypothetical protein